MDRSTDGAYYDRAEVERETAQSRGMFVRELPKMFGYVLFFYAMLGVGIPWRLELSRDAIWTSTKASLVFGAAQGGIILVVGALVMSAYALRKAVYTDFGPAASWAMLWSFRIFAVVGVPLALWDVFRVVLPTVGSAGDQFARDWWMWLLLVATIAGWYSGRSVGGLIGLLAIWLSGARLLKRLS